MFDIHAYTQVRTCSRDNSHIKFIGFSSTKRVPNWANAGIVGCIAHQSAVQLCSTTSRTFLLYSRLFSLNIRAASEFAGELGFGSQSNDCIFGCKWFNMSTSLKYSNPSNVQIYASTCRYLNVKALNAISADIHFSRVLLSKPSRFIRVGYWWVNITVPPQISSSVFKTGQPNSAAHRLLTFLQQFKGYLLENNTEHYPLLWKVHSSTTLKEGNIFNLFPQ